MHYNTRLLNCFKLSSRTENLWNIKQFSQAITSLPMFDCYPPEGCFLSRWNTFSNFFKHFSVLAQFLLPFAKEDWKYCDILFLSLSLQIGMLRPLKQGTGLWLTFSTSSSMMVITIVWRTRFSLSLLPLPRGSHLLSASAVALKWAQCPISYLTGFIWRFFRRSWTFCGVFHGQVQEGGRVQLSTNHIIASDPDTPRKDLLVWLIRPPKFGFIENTKQGESLSCLRVALYANFHFSVTKGRCFCLLTV